MRASGNKRERGAYFTPTWLAELLAGWSVRASHEIVIDPAAGRGDLLLAAAARLARLGKAFPQRVHGVELHDATARALRARLNGHARETQLLHGDFFALSSELPLCDVVLANPPYVRHQEISASGTRLMRAALDGSAHLVSGRASAWAYFLVHAPILLKPHGRLAFVLPSEVLTSDYAGPIVEHLAKGFKTLTLIHCNGEVFSDLNQQTVLLLAEDYIGLGIGRGAVRWASLDVGSHNEPRPSGRLTQVVGKPLPLGSSLMRLMAPSIALDIERSLRQRPELKNLGSLTSIGIGYVTGNNNFFHLTEQERKALGIGTRHLTRVLTRSRGIVGTEFTDRDWRRHRAHGRPCWLLTPANARDRKIRNLLQRGRRAGVHSTYKCSIRPCWWKVPTKEAPPAIMVYMGTQPAILVNNAAVLVSNTLLELRDLKEVSAGNLAIASLTSVFRLSAILNSRPLGGGLRKLEPSDAQRILIPVADVSSSEAGRIERLVRQRRPAKARSAADALMLVKKLGWSRATVQSIQSTLSSLECAISANKGRWASRPMAP